MFHFVQVTFVLRWPRAWCVRAHRVVWTAFQYGFVGCRFSLYRYVELQTVATLFVQSAALDALHCTCIYHRHSVFTGYNLDFLYDKRC